MNNEHSGIKYVTPQQRHCGEDNEILRQRMQVYRRAKLTHPGRWSMQTRDWNYIDEVYLNPEKCAAKSFTLLNCKNSDNLLEKQRLLGDLLG